MLMHINKIVMDEEDEVAEDPGAVTLAGDGTAPFVAKLKTGPGGPHPSPFLALTLAL